MPITVSGTNIVFNDSTTQTTAFTGAAGQIQTQLFTSSSSWTAPTGVTKAVAIIAGAGGGGNFGYAVNGGNGGFASALITVVPGTSYSVTIGSGGNGGTNAGNSGGSSSFASFISANGGGGGGTNNTGGNGTGTVSSGTAIRTGNVNFGGYGLQYGGYYPLAGQGYQSGGSPTAYSTSNAFCAGAHGSHTENAGGGGIGGALFIQWVG
jgi:hypothetical protein